MGRHRKVGIVDVAPLTLDNLTPEVTARLALLLGVPPARAAALAGAAIPAVLAALLQQAQGASAVAVAIRCGASFAELRDRLAHAPGELAAGALDEADWLLGPHAFTALAGRFRAEQQLAPRTARTLTGLAAAYTVAGLRAAADAHRLSAGEVLERLQRQEGGAAPAQPTGPAESGTAQDPPGETLPGARPAEAGWVRRLLARATSLLLFALLSRQLFLGGRTPARRRPGA